MTPETAFTTLKPFIAKHGTPLQREAFAALKLTLRERTLKIKALQIERHEALAARAAAIDELRSRDAELALLNDRLDQMQIDYQLFQTVALPNIPHRVRRPLFRRMAARSGPIARAARSSHRAPRP